MIALFPAICLLFAATLCADALDQIQTWTSLDGRTLEATLLEVDADAKIAQMRYENGQTFTVKWSQLAHSDRSLLRKLATATGQHKLSNSTSNNKLDPKENEPLPQDFELRNVPMIKQKGNFCVPASACMIAGYHGIETDQDEVAQLSSQDSISNEGTYPSDMLLAMEKLGFEGHSLLWEDVDPFYKNVLPAIRRALVDTGPIYISFKSGVFGTMGHGCVIIGYNDRREEMIFHNPWGNVFEKKYNEVATQGRGVVFIDPPKPAPIASDEFITCVQDYVPHFDGDFLALSNRLTRAGQAFELMWCSRRDAREDERFAIDTARRDGRKILELAFERNPAVLIPSSPDGETTMYYLVTRPPEGGASFLVREITLNGWGVPELKTLGSLTREWPTQFKLKDSDVTIWELPMIELRENVW